METKDREIKTVMHSLKTRVLTVKRIENITPVLRRITLTGDDLEGFTSLSPDDHIKVFFPYPGEEKPVVPVLGGPQGPTTEDGRKPIMRDYTPRRYDLQTKELDIEFVLHGEGPGSSWAAQATVGKQLTIGGPRGSRVVPYSFDWYLLVGDESALPSIARRLEEMPAEAPCVVVIEVENAQHEISLQLKPQQSVHWLHREGRAQGDVEGFRTQLLQMPLPKGDYFAWISAEKACAMELKNLLVTVKGGNEEWIKATGYWIKEN